MPFKLFATLDDTQGLIKIVHLWEEGYNRHYEHALFPYTPENEPMKLPICLAKDTQPNLQRLTLKEGDINLWRTPWTVQHKNVWLPVLDSDYRDSLPGSFIFSTNAFPANEIRVQIQLRETIMRKLGPRAPPASAPPPLPAPNHPGIPAFVAHSMLRDAIAHSHTCPISMEPLTAENASITSCYHLFQRDSITRWLAKNKACPVCKTTTSFVQPISQ